jgi:hypothetical protein
VLQRSEEEMDTPTGDLHASIGVARLDITPPEGTRWKLWGAATQETADGVHRPLTATALAIVADDDPLLILSVDVCEWADLADETIVRQRILNNCGLHPDRLLLHSTHTHSGQAPCTRHAPLTGGQFLAEHLELIASQASAAAAQAIATAAPATLTWGVGRSQLAAYRDEVRDGRAVVGYDPDTRADDTVLVGRVTTAAQGVVAVLVSYACHPTVLGWGNRLISPDYVGAMRELIEDQLPGSTAIFLQGASGELAPARQYSQDPADADRAGRALGHAVLAALELMPAADHRLAPMGIVESGAPLGIWAEQQVAATPLVRVARLDLNLPRKLQPATMAAELPQHVRAERLARAELVSLAAGAAAELPYPVWLWELGPLVLVAHPGEAYSWLATHLREVLAPRPVLIANLTNGAGAFYLPPRTAYEHPSYTVEQTPAGPGSLEQVAQAVLAALGVDPNSPSLQPTIQEP